MTGLAPDVLALVAVVVFVGGVVQGIAGFGNAIVSTATLATLIEPSVAVVIVIVPLLAANLTLVASLDRSALRSCLVRFWPYLLAALAGTLAGMTLLGSVDESVLALGLGLFTLTYVAFTQSRVAIPGEAWFRARCFRPGGVAKAALGLVSGAIFGASNAAVQVVAYLDSQDLDRGTFVGVLAMILVGISGMRVLAAWGLGLYGGTGVLAASVLAAAPGVAGVTVGQRLRRHVPVAYQTVGALALLTVIGLRLTASGLA